MTRLGAKKTKLVGEAGTLGGRKAFVADAGKAFQGATNSILHNLIDGRGGSGGSVTLALLPRVSGMAGQQE